MNSKESVEMRARNEGMIDAGNGRAYRSGASEGSFWDKCYRAGYECTPTIQDKNEIVNQRGEV